MRGEGALRASPGAECWKAGHVLTRRRRRNKYYGIVQCPAVVTDGRCMFCYQAETWRKMPRHLLGHFAEKAPAIAAAGTNRACLARITGHSPIRYWLYARIGSRATLRELDALLRDTWLECCGHLSSFRSDDMSYESSDIDLDLTKDGVTLMDVNAASVLAKNGSLRYRYDYGTTTELFVQFGGMCPGGGIRHGAVELAAINVEMPHDCAGCGRADAGMRVCTNCIWEDKETLLCGACAKNHRHGGGPNDETFFLRFRNSPRMGMCAYGGYVE